MQTVTWSAPRRPEVNVSCPNGWLSRSGSGLVGARAQASFSHLQDSVELRQSTPARRRKGIPEVPAGGRGTRCCVLISCSV